MTPLQLLRTTGLGLVLALGACSTAPEPAPPPAPAKPAPAKVSKKQNKKPAIPQPASKPEPPAVTPAPQPSVTSEPEVATAPPQPLTPPPEVVMPPVLAQPSPPPAAVQPPPPPLDVVGRSDAEVVALLGRPVREQVASAAKVMRFAADGCAVEVHFFPDVKQGGYRALEMVGAGPVTASQCLGKVRAARG